ncbi:MAG: TraR/DksA C4-type zinc finger protein [Candidatus Shapirobacteria bacterium]|jgi:RNA polymerase-binding transcription factor DksA|nr:TraR/DksA C4-type zinc finger protein [Candidatus Shapirobacteria bacterium]
MKNKIEDKQKISFPQKLISPIKHFLEKELLKSKRAKKDLKSTDPFLDNNRTLENSLEEDLDEQIGHFETEVKAKFLSKRIVQLRKALTNIKLGKYGLCERCGKMIDTDRLSINPSATTCVKCEKEKEA